MTKKMTCKCRNFVAYAQQLALPFDIDGDHAVMPGPETGHSIALCDALAILQGVDAIGKLMEGMDDPDDVVAAS